MRRRIQITVLSLGMVLALPVFAWQEVVVKKTDSLSALASKYHPAGVSNMDMVIAIRNANPALVAHGLRPNMHLCIPTTETEVRQAITGKMQKAAPLSKKAKSTDQAVQVTKKEKSSVPVAVVAVKAHDTALQAQITANKATIANLQQGLNNQMQTIQADQQQISALTAQLAAANQSIASAATAVKAVPSWSWADLFLPLWVITLAFYLRLRRKYKARLQYEEAHIPRTAEVQQEPLFTAALQEEAENSAREASDEGWRQVELDIPESETPVQTNIRLEPLLTTEEKAELVGEQQNIINALSNDHDNVDWHMALLEFYTKTNNESGYQRHYQNMLRSGLMQEGDSLWEKVRKIYLNQWVYRTEGA